MELHIHEKPDVTIALNMIVKNEAHIIIKTLENLCSYFDFSYWVICDTGSTDGTQKLIEDFFLSKKIKGELHQSEWKNFGYNRSEALVKAYNKSDYLLIFDADDSIKGNLVLPETFDFDTYKLMFGETGGFRYSRPLLINNRKKYKFIGVLHEYLTSAELSDTTADLKGDYYLISGREGNRSKDVNKYLKDAAVLEQAIVEEKDKFLKNRYVFYCAQSYKDGGNRAKAIEYYKKCLDLPIWDQERYYSACTLGDLYKRSNDDEKALFYWLKSSEYDTHRIEGIVNASCLYREKGMNNMVCTLYKTYKNYKQWNGEHIRKLFIDTGKYNNMLELCCSICAGYASRELKYLGYEACKEILMSNKLENNHITTTIHNLQFYKKYLEEDSDTLGLFTAFDDYLAKTPYTSNAWNDDLWHRLFDKNVPALTAPTKHTPAANNAQPWIMITLTTCKRFHLFEKTMNSILNQWSDYKKIDYWFCVDDNSSIEDREKMKEAYPWCDFYWKTMEEKGHRKSMNIIWDKLNTLKPKYWIHMEDDFLFHTNMNYIGRAIEGLRQLKGENVKQILFNRCYGETIRDYRLVSYIKKDNGFSLQDYKQGSFNSYNSHYWPHFSFRPSMVDCEAILKLGNFDSHNQFFEMDYAQRWVKAGYKSGFFNRITNRHIGRLTSERSQKNIPNAYELNSERQFVSLPPYINIVHLERRLDRKKSTIEKLSQAGIDKYQFITAVDGRELILTKTQYEMFQGNDFGSRRGVVGCALSHYNLWKQLLEDKDHNFYLIMEDDCTLSENFKENLEILKKEMEKKDVVFLGYHMFEKEREKVKKKYNCSTSTVKLAALNKSIYIGGTFCYLINKNGAKKIVKYIAKNGIKHGIDYLMKIVPNINTYETRPQLAFSDWNENGKKIDTDIQTDTEPVLYKDYAAKFVFVKEKDQCGFDVHFNNKLTLEEKLIRAIKDPNIIAVNTLGFFKHRVEDLTSSPYFSKNDGIYIKKEYYKTYQNKKDNIIRIKMLCNWCSSEQLCKEWSNMCEEGLRWKNIEITHEDENIDYYVIINKPQEGAIYIPEKTIIFQMEPWVGDVSKNWGVQTWGEWSIPDEKKFLYVGRHKNHLNNVEWHIKIPIFFPENRKDRALIFLSKKNFDLGHIKRIQFLKKLEDWQKEEDGPLIDIYGRENYHSLSNYIGPVDIKSESTHSLAGKGNHFKIYKYCFAVENNNERNYATEKIWEPILCECLCFYWGCLNITDYIDAKAFVQLDMNNFEKSYQIIKKAIKEDWWSQRIDIIRKEKQKILNELAFFPTLHKIIFPS